MRSANLLPAVLSALLCASAVAQSPDQHHAQAQDAAPPSIAERTAGMKAMPGLLPLFWDANSGKLFLEVPKLDEDGRSPDLLYTNSLPYGTGSNDLGLDRGQTSEGIIVHFERVGPKVLLVEPNERFRSSSSDPAEVLAVRQSFPESVLAGFKVEAADPDHAVLLDATDFFVRDAHGVLHTLTQLKQGAYKLDPMRSSIALDRTRAFPKNTEVEAILTFTTEAPANRSFVSEVAPDPDALTIREHQSFLELPGPGFIPRRFDPRAGYFPSSYRDYTVPLGEQLEQQFIIRHRLNKKDPSCRTACVAEQPIQYYVDRGAPEPIRTALLEGARWWDQAFQAAGWAPGTFKVDLLPEGANPMDVRYNIIQWVHRYTRGWSYGAAIADPRTGEIIKGNVTLGSLRGRQDYLIAEALLAPYADGKKYTPEDDPMLAMVLERIRQLAAHETGHTLGLAHNFAASAYPHSNRDQTISVMDYPAPYITLDSNGVPDLSHAYPVGIGLWDKVAIDYGYREFPARSNVHEELNKILTSAQKAGIPYLTDEDARPFGSASPIAHLWDNGSDPAAELNRTLTIRQAALTRFGENAIRPGMPLAQLEDTLVPLYLLHRYQTEAAIKEIGGLNYNYALRGDGQPLPTIVSAGSQQTALAAVLKTLTPQVLAMPESLLKLFPPRPPGLPRTPESFPSHTGLTFDPIAAAESAADLTLQVLLDPARASRLVEYHTRESQSPSLASVLEAISHTVAARPEAPDSFSSEVARAVEVRAYEAMFSLAMNPAASTQARAVTLAHLVAVGQEFTRLAAPQDRAEAAHRAYLLARLHEFQRDPAKFTPAKPIEAPPGMPIGMADDF